MSVTPLKESSQPRVSSDGYHKLVFVQNLFWHKICRDTSWRWRLQTHRLPYGAGHRSFWIWIELNLSGRVGHIANLDVSLCKLAKILELPFVKEWDIARPSTPCIFIVHKMKKKVIKTFHFRFQQYGMTTFPPRSSLTQLLNQTYLMRNLANIVFTVYARYCTEEKCTLISDLKESMLVIGTWIDHR